MDLLEIGNEEFDSSLGMSVEPSEEGWMHEAPDDVVLRVRVVRGKPVADTVVLSLTASPLTTLYVQPSVSVSKDDADLASELREVSKTYKEKCVHYGAGEGVSTSHAQTVPCFPKNKAVNTQRLHVSNQGTSVTECMIFDALDQSEIEVEEELPPLEESVGSVVDDDASVLSDGVSTIDEGTIISQLTNVSPSLISDGTIRDEFSALNASIGAASHIETEKSSRVQRAADAFEANPGKALPLLQTAYKIVEEITGGALVARFLDFVYPSETAKTTESGKTTEMPPSLSLTKASLPRALEVQEFATLASPLGLPATSISRSEQQPNLMAVGYGHIAGQRGAPEDEDIETRGCIAVYDCYCPSGPILVCTVTNSVTQLAWHPHHPHLLAYGLHDGTVALLNLSSLSEVPGSWAAPVSDFQPTMVSTHATGKHNGCVWGLEWLLEADEKRKSLDSDALLSVGADGVVSQRSLRKGWESVELLRLAGGGSGLGGGGVVGRTSPALSVSVQNTFYLISSVGTVHLGSLSYCEQTVSDFVGGHDGPVYAVRHSLAPSIFASGGEDRFLVVWNGDVYKRISVSDVITCLCWSPYDATVLAVGCADGKVSIFDFSQSPLDPIVTLEYAGSVSDVRLSHVLVVALASGDVVVSGVRGLAVGAPAPEEAEDELCACFGW